MVYAAGIVESLAVPGGLGVWFPTKGEHAVKGEETNFLMTAQLPHATVSPASDSLRPHLSQLVFSSTTDTLGDITESKKAFPVRHGLIRKYGRIRMLTTTRDAHIYLLPYWILDFLNQNPTFDSISEDLIGWWAKATWQPGLIPKLGLDHILSPSPRTKDSITDTENPETNNTNLGEEGLNLQNMSTTQTSSILPTPPTTPSSTSDQQHQSPSPQATMPHFL
ncbi:MAG: hypothetical protein Q9196_006342, partial [Gyalolechia fulgens]